MTADPVDQLRALGRALDVVAPDVTVEEVLGRAEPSVSQAAAELLAFEPVPARWRASRRASALIGAAAALVLVAGLAALAVVRSDREVDDVPPIESSPVASAPPTTGTEPGTSTPPALATSPPPTTITSSVVPASTEAATTVPPVAENPDVLELVDGNVLGIGFGSTLSDAERVLGIDPVPIAEMPDSEPFFHGCTGTEDPQVIRSGGLTLIFEAIAPAEPRVSNWNYSGGPAAGYSEIGLPGGIRLGDTRAKVVATYPNFVDYGDEIGLSDPSVELRFSDGVLTEFGVVECVFERSPDDPLLPPVEYFGARGISDEPGIEIHRFAPSGEDLGAVPAADVADLINTIPLPDGRRIRIVPDAIGGRCRNDVVTVSDGVTDVALHPDLRFARSIVATGAGAVFATRDVCPDGAAWGDEGTSWQLVRVDLTRPDDGVTVLAEQLPDVSRDAELDQTSVETISPDGRYLGMEERVALDAERWQVRDATTGELVQLATSCTPRGDIAAPPRFLADGTVVVARYCPKDGGEFVVEHVDLTTNSVLWSAAAPAVHSSYFGHSVALSATMTDDGPWVIVTGAEVLGDDTGTTLSVLIHGDEQVVLSQPGFVGFAFSPTDLLG